MHWLRVIHRWIGLLLGLIVILVAGSGGLLLLRGPYYRAALPVLAQPITVEELAVQGRALEGIDQRFGGRTERITLPRPGMNAFALRLEGGSEALIDPRTGQVLAQWTWRDSLPAFLFELHAHLLLDERGTVLNGAAALLMLFLASSGALLWWPRRRAAFRLRRVVPRRAATSDLLRSHASAGVLVLVPTLVLAATGAALTFYSPVSTLLSTLLDARPPARPDRMVSPRAIATRPWPVILQRAAAAFPDDDLIMLHPGSATNAVVTFRTRLPGEWHPNGRSYVLVDPYEGRVVQTIDARQQGLGTRLAFAVYPLHAAKVGGALYVTFVALGALGLVWLAVVGLVAAFPRLRRAASRR